MDSQFWIKSWTDGRTAFNQQQYHDKLMQFFPQLNPQSGQSVLVPLCGKTIDMVWLAGLGLHVHGVELFSGAVEDFFSENKLQPVEKSQEHNFVKYFFQNILISCGDFFKLKKDNGYDFIYDRAALVALPASMRKNYAQVIKQSLKRGGKYLLIIYEYDQSKMDGPPFSIRDDEIQSLYADQFSIKLMEIKKPSNEGSRLAAIESLHQKVYILEKIR